MNAYLARLSALNSEKGIREQPSKPSKPSSERFEGDEGIGKSKKYTQNRDIENSKSVYVGNLQNPEQSGTAFPFANALDDLERRCPDYIEPDRWQQCVEDAQRFLATWGDKALALGWTTGELFGLHEPPAQPHPSYSRLSRYDHTGLVWNLLGRRVVALTENTAAIEGHTGNITVYRKLNKPAYGPLGDSLDDFIA
jgi:hypothetical protein